jgi:hypothetical protein
VVSTRVQQGTDRNFFFFFFFFGERRLIQLLLKMALQLTTNNQIATKVAL